MTNYQITNTISEQEQNMILERVAKRINTFTDSQATVNDNIMYVDGVRIFFSDDFMVTPFTAPTAAREIIKDYNDMLADF